MFQTRFEKQYNKIYIYIFNDIPVMFSPNISSVLKISYNEMKIERYIKSKEKLMFHYHFFIFPFSYVINDKEYVINIATFFFCP